MSGPVDRHALAARLDRTCEVWESTIGTHWCEPLRAAAAALREDAELAEDAARWRKAEEYRRVELNYAKAERDAALAEVARLRDGIERHREETLRPEHRVGGRRDHRLWALLDTEEGPTNE